MRLIPIGNLPERGLETGSKEAQVGQGEGERRQERGQVKLKIGAKVVKIEAKLKVERVLKNALKKKVP